MQTMILGISTVRNFFQLVGVLLVFVFVLAIAHFTTRWIAKYQQGQVNHKNIKPIETFRITNGKYIQILKVGGKYIVIAICKDSITMLTELQEEEVTEFSLEMVETPKPNFQQILDEIKKRMNQKQK